MKTSAFWIIPSVHALNGFTTHAVYVHGLIRLTDAGFSIAVASTVFAIYGFIEILMRVFGSFIGDLIDKRHAIWIFCAIQGLGVVFLALIPDTSEDSSTAIMMPLNGARRSSQQCDCLEKAANRNVSGHDKKNGMKHGNLNTSTMLNNGNSCERYDKIIICQL